MNEQVLELRAWIQAQARRGLRRWLLISCWPREGKTWLVAQLAEALAGLGLKVTLVDLDLSTRALTRSFESKFQGTLLRLLPAPAGSGTLPAVHFSSQAFRNQCKEAESWSDFVIYDAPCLNFSRDVLLLPQLFDGALMVSSAARLQGTPEGLLSEDLRDHGIEIFGVIQT